MLSSSTQASLSGRFGNSEYGKSKLAGEELFLNTLKRMILKHMSIDSQILWVIVDLNITVRYQHFVGRLLTMKNSLLMIEIQN